MSSLRRRLYRTSRRALSSLQGYSAAGVRKAEAPLRPCLSVDMVASSICPSSATSLARIGGHADAEVYYISLSYLHGTAPADDLSLVEGQRLDGGQRLLSARAGLVIYSSVCQRASLLVAGVDHEDPGIFTSMGFSVPFFARYSTRTMTIPPLFSPRPRQRPSLIMLVFRRVLPFSSAVVPQQRRGAESSCRTGIPRPPDSTGSTSVSVVHSFCRPRFGSKFDSPSL